MSFTSKQHYQLEKSIRFVCRTVLPQHTRLSRRTAGDTRNTQFYMITRHTPIPGHLLHCMDHSADPGVVMCTHGSVVPTIVYAVVLLASSFATKWGLINLPHLLDITNAERLMCGYLVQLINHKRCGVFGV